MGYKMVFVFIKTKKGKRLGKIVKRNTLKEAKVARLIAKQEGYNVSLIAKKRRYKI